MKRAARARTILTAALLCTILFIFGNSMLSSGISKKISSTVTIFLGGEPTVEDKDSNMCGDAAKKKEKGPEFYVRKGGHLLEYAILGGEMTLLLLLRKRENHKKSELFRGLFFLATTVPLLDETVQIFSGRGPMVEDIWIDITGIVIGSLFMNLLWKLFHRKQAENKAPSP